MKQRSVETSIYSSKQGQLKRNPPTRSWYVLASCFSFLFSRRWVEGIEGHLETPFLGAISSQIYVGMFCQRRPCQPDCSLFGSWWSFKRRTHGMNAQGYSSDER
jgi:hypothetical protein